MRSSSAALDHLLANKCGLSEELRQDFSDPFGVLLTIYMAPTLIFVAAKAKERENGMLQRAQERVGLLLPNALSGCCKASREMRDERF